MLFKKKLKFKTYLTSNIKIPGHDVAHVLTDSNRLMSASEIKYLNTLSKHRQDKRTTLTLNANFPTHKLQMINASTIHA